MQRGVKRGKREEEQTFLLDEERAEEDGGTPFHWTKSQPPSSSPHISLPVHSNIHL